MVLGFFCGRVFLVELRGALDGDYKIEGPMTKEEREELKEQSQREQAQQEQAQRERDPQERARRERAQQERAWQRQQQQQREQKQHEKAGQERAQQDSGERDDGGEAGGQAWFVVLGVAATASIEEITKAYKTLISQYHPDKVATLGPKLKMLAEKESKKINAAIKEARRLHAKNM